MRRRAAFVSATVAAVAVVAAVAAGCAARFDPTGPCTTDGRVAGAYPDLEAQVPRLFRGNPPTSLDSGRDCTSNGLGTLTGHGVAELRFAGARWTTGSESGLSLALFESGSGPTLTRDWLAEFYETGARAGKNVTSVEPSDYPVDQLVTGRRIDVLNGESFQTVVVWERGGRIEAAVIADAIREIETREAHDAVVRDAVAAWAAFDAGAT